MLKPSVTIFSGIQILTCVLTLIVQYIFVNHTYYESFTRMHAPTVWGTMILRLVFGSTFGVSGVCGVWSSYKKTTIPICVTLIAAAVSSCFCLVFLGESAICATYVVSKMDETFDVQTFYPTKDDSVTINIEIGEDSNDIMFSYDHAKLLLALFSTQLFLCLIHGGIVMFFCSELNKHLREIQRVKSYFTIQQQLYNNEICSMEI